MIKSTHKAFADNILFALNIFIIVLLLAGDHLVIPRWLQPVGRMHPLILHFPIVLLILAMLMEFFRFRSTFSGEKLYQDFATLLLLLGALFSAITAIMGLFLAREPGYEGSDVEWHKWFGVSIVFVSSLIYWARSKPWYSLSLARSGSIATVAFLFVAGHYGASVTHGDDFLLAPVMNNSRKLVPIDQALVYRDVVQPIFDTKCIGCHNESKLKGGLMLIDEKSILKGGKDGKLIVPGQPQVSLLLQRIHLPEEEKKHMPPVGKPQLTHAEMAVLFQWVKENADFKEKVTDLPLSDSLRLASTSFLKPAEESDEQYNFSAADEKTIKKLGNNYRVINQLAQGSPALSVDIYNKAAYNPKVLEDLAPIKKQIVALNVDKMPVKDAELKIIAQFENLRTLNLDFTDITGSTLNNLSSLKCLRSLSLAGDKLTTQALASLHSFKSLKEVTVWNTGLNAGDIAKLQSANKNVEFIQGFKDNGKPMKLIPPQLKNTAFVFKKPVELIISNPIKGTDIRYTTDGKDPDSVNSPVYKPGIIISDNITIKARSYKTGWYGSDVVTNAFYKDSLWPDSVSLVKPVNERYSADGAHTIIDGELGGMNFGNNKWLGTQQDMEFMLYFKNPVTPHALTLNCLKMIGSQIFLPTEIEVWGGTDAQHMRPMGSLTTATQKKGEPDIAMGLNCKLRGGAPVTCLRVVAKPIYKLPDWHPAKGKPSWVFVDEVLVN
ncbi:MAG: chitobiase/beta-hexosaminidase C-terminal domain-containing protein [Bacteroidetes bacterium]|nr:chitobiase/beta-hexosaminidase C-terminal domain-containing protein [Bacteroidota bacterium]